MNKAAILAAGDSTRMLPLSAYVPKHVLPVGGKALIHHTLAALRDAGVKEVLIVCGYHQDRLREHVNPDQWAPLEISFVTQEQRRGTAHAAAHARKFAGEDEIVIVYGDVIFGHGTLQGLIRKHDPSRSDLTICTVRVEDPSSYGIILAEKGRAVGLVEKPSSDQISSNLANAGIYVAGPALWEAIDATQLSPRGEYEITDSISLLIKRDRVDVYETSTWWLDIGRPWDLLRANELVLSESKGSVEGVVEDGATLKNNVIVEKGATVRSGAYIEGPCFIGEGSVVGPNCYIRPATSLGKGVKVGNAVEIKNSIVMDNTSIGHLSYVGDSIIGHHVNFGAGTITANLRHDDRHVRVTLKGTRVSSGRRKLGAIVGDNVKTGIGTLISPGVVIHQDARTGVGLIVDRDIDPNTLVIAEQPKRVIPLRPDE